MTWWHKLALGTVPVVGVCLCLLFFQIGDSVEQASADIHALSLGGVSTLGLVDKTTKSADRLARAAATRVDDFGTTQTKLNSGLDLLTHRLTDLCSSPQGCGLIPDASRTLNTARGTMGQFEIAARSFDQHQSTFYQQEVQLSAGAQATVLDLDRFISSPELASVVNNLDTSSTALASASKHIDATTGDIQFEADKLAHPAKKKLGFWGSIWAGAQVVRKVSPPLF